MAGLTKLTIQACTLSKSGAVTPKTGAADTFTALINPAELERAFGIDYGSDQDPDIPINGNSQNKKYARYVPESVSFALVLDSTGVVPPATPAPPGSPPPEPTPVATLIEQLKSVCYTYKGDYHEPNVVKLNWAENFDNFHGRTRELNLSYTLFKPTGEPLRAKLKLKFVRYTSNAEAQKEKGDNSPDMTHAVIVRDGDTLPLLCERIYRDGSHYPMVARFNGLTDFRSLQPNTVLHFPPLT
ncbi:MAG: peptidoglycan-binding protein [Alphaproteobacteria bacterium]|nr:peptidoglycan-binding protein [Alphaproteobacteria bacterium]MCB9931164.1 peptidoglycan-binding protein [Alphaproteobacteria bacterium]